MKKVNSFDVLKRMAAQSMDIRMAPGSNVQYSLPQKGRRAMPNDKHLSDEQIDALLKEVGEREAKATPGPWEIWGEAGDMSLLELTNHAR